MRKVAVVLTVLAAVALFAPLASAQLTDVNDLGAGSWQAKFSDYSDLYVPTTVNGVTTYSPLPFGGSSVPIGSENRAIFYVTSIQPQSGPPAAWLPGTPPAGQQLTGVFYNLSLAFEVPTYTGTTLTGLNLYYVQSSRNPLPGTPANYGGVIEVYDIPTSTTPNFTANPGAVSALTGSALPATGTLASTANSYFTSHNVGPNYWVQGTAGARDSYTGTTGTAAQLWLSGTFVDWATIAPYSPLIASDLAAVDSLDPGLDPVFSETLNLNTGTGSAVGDIHLLGGSFLPSMQLGDVGLGPQVDMTLLSDLATPIVANAGTKSSTLYPSGGDYSGVGYWPIDSQDPVNFNVIPEPATMTLLGLGLMGIGAIRRRVKKS